MSKAVVVIRGGNTARLGSMKTGEAFVASLPYTNVRDVVLKRDGTCIMDGRVVSLDRACAGADVIINALHGEDGEGGKIQQMCDRHGVCYTGSSPIGAKFSLHKVLAREVAKSSSIPSLPYIFVEHIEALDASIAEAIRLFGQPLVIKPVRGAGSEGVAILQGLSYIEAEARERFIQDGSVLIEPYVRGSHANVFVLQDFRGSRRYVLPIVEVARLGDEWVHRCPPDFSHEHLNELGKHAEKLFDALMLRHYAQFKFAITGKGITFMEVNALPRLGGGALFSKSLNLAGVSDEQFAGHLISLAESKF